MKIVVVGGQSRNVGKTSLACGLIAGLPERNWTAVKITQFGHGFCASDGKTCDCAAGSPEHPYALGRELNADGTTDTARMLRAGAREVYWLRALQGRLKDALPLASDRWGGDANVLIESNSVLDYLEADVYLPVIDASVEDYKPSALRLLPRANALAVVGGELNQRTEQYSGARRFAIAAPDYCSPEIVAFVRDRLAG
jgi:hypothetical protein